MRTPNLQQRPWTAPTRKACWIYFPCTYKWKMQTNKQTNKQTQILHTCNRSTDTVSAGQKSKPWLFALFSVCGDVFIRLTEADAATAWQRWQFFFCLFVSFKKTQLKYVWLCERHKATNESRFDRRRIFFNPPDGYTDNIKKQRENIQEAPGQTCTSCSSSSCCCCVRARQLRFIQSATQKNKFKCYILWPFLRSVTIFFVIQEPGMQNETSNEIGQKNPPHIHSMTMKSLCSSVMRNVRTTMYKKKAKRSFLMK